MCSCSYILDEWGANRFYFFSQFWVGLNDMEKEGQWTWINGHTSLPSEISWLSGQPNIDETKNCGCVGYDNKMRNKKCSSNYRGLCEKPFT